MPMPRKLSEDSASITKQKSSAATVSSVGSTPGATWRRMAAQLPVPNVRAASMNSRLRSSAASARAVRRYTGTRATASTSTMLAALGENTYSTTTASSSDGKLRITSATRSDTLSRQPP